LKAGYKKKDIPSIENRQTHLLDISSSHTGLTGSITIISNPTKSLYVNKISINALT